MPEPRIEATRVSARIYSVLFDKATRDTYCEFLGPVLPDPPCGGRKTGLMSGQHVWEQLASQSRLAILCLGGVGARQTGKGHLPLRRSATALLRPLLAIVSAFPFGRELPQRRK